MRRSTILLCASLTLTVACSDNGALDPLGPDNPAPPSEPQTLISDAVHGVDGNEHFFWLPPLVPQPESYNSDFDGSREPTVEICEWDDTTQLCVLPLVAAFTMNTGPGSETIRVVPEDEHYIVNWHTDEFDVTAGTTYRIAMLADGGEVGVADVVLAANGGEVNNLSTGQTIGLKDGRTLPIKFRMEEGVPFVVATDQDATIEALSGEVTLDIPANSVQGSDPTVEFTVESVDAVAGQQSIIDIGPDGTVFDEQNPMILTVAYDENALGGVAETDLAVNLLDETTGVWYVVPGSTFDVLNNVGTAPVFHLSQFGVGAAARAVFCSGDSNPNTFDDMQAALDAVMLGGTVEVCAGRHTIQRVNINKGVTIEGKGRANTTLTTGGGQFGLLTDFDTGSLTVRKLLLEVDFANGNFATPLFLTYPYGDVLVDDVEIRLVQFGMGVFVGSTSVPNARLTLQNVDFTGNGLNGVRATEGARVDVLNSQVTGQFDRPIFYYWGASGLIQGNTINCGSHSCIAVQGPGNGYSQVEPVRVIGNTATASGLQQTFVGIFVDPGDQTYQILGNSVTGVTPSGDRSDRGGSAYSFWQQGIRVRNPDAAGEVSGNTVSSARDGIIVAGGSVAATGLDNTVSAVWVPVEVVVGGQMTVQSSDFSDYIVPINPDPGRALGIGGLTCNWWGDVNGPVGVDPSIPAGVYTPWATSAVAGSSTTSC